MIADGKRHELRPGDQRGKTPPCLETDRLIVARMNDERRRGHLRVDLPPYGVILVALNVRWCESCEGAKVRPKVRGARCECHRASSCCLHRRHAGTPEW